MKVSQSREEDFIPVSKLTIFPGTSGQFELYLKRKDGFILYSNKGELFSFEDKIADALDVAHFYILKKDKMEYEQYLAKNLGDLLQNDQLPLKERSKMLYNVSTGIIKNIFENKMPKSFNKQLHEKLFHLVKASIKFMSLEDALKSMSQFISHNYHTYSHSAQVMVLLISILQGYPEFDDKKLVQVGMGTILHDIGKTEIPHEVLNKPGKLDAHEWEMIKTHPARGINLCTGIPLTQMSINCILFHHEKYDGSGYPAGLKGEDIPLEARALMICDVYDALTTDRPYATALTPYEALKFIKEELKDTYDPDLFKRLVHILSSARMV